jgi:hypothetical protein
MQGRSRLSRTAVLGSRQPASEVLGELRRITEPLDGSFQLLSKLSPGGIVIRVLKAPKTERPFFGRVGDEGSFTIAMVPRGERLTPYQPMIHGRVLDEGDSSSRIELKLAPHPQARTYSGVFGLAALMVGAVSLLRFFAQPAVALLGLFFAVAFAVFPTWRAKQGFGVSAAETLDLLRANIPLEERV